MLDEADPLAGWPMEEILRKTPVARNDIYGGLFFLVRELLIDFCSRIRALKVDFVLLYGNATELPKTLSRHVGLTPLFDRIEV